MQLKEYITTDEVKRVCKELGFRDWSELKDLRVTEAEAVAIRKIVNKQDMDIPLESFRAGLDVELEHGTRYPDANVTNNHPILTGKIVLAHLKETMDYYERLEVTEIEGDLLKAVKARDMARIESKYRALIAAQGVLARTVAENLK